MLDKSGKLQENRKKYLKIEKNTLKVNLSQTSQTSKKSPQNSERKEESSNNRLFHNGD